MYSRVCYHLTGLLIGVCLSALSNVFNTQTKSHSSHAALMAFRSIAKGVPSCVLECLPFVFEAIFSDYVTIEKLCQHEINACRPNLYTGFSIYFSLQFFSITVFVQYAYM